jgi:hypothetical protein
MVRLHLRSDHCRLQGVARLLHPPWTGRRSLPGSYQELPEQAYAISAGQGVLPIPLHAQRLRERVNLVDKP